MPNSPQTQRDGTTKTYNISVVGPPKSGKSCLCNRFALPHPDFYREDHLTVLSAADFGSEIVNSEHWLYWGCVSRRIDGCTVNFRIIEQTEFLDDCTFQPFAPKMRYGGLQQDYLHRSSATRLSSERKLRYICKEQLGQETTYEMEYFPSGNVEINGFILVCDIGLPHLKVAHRSERNLLRLKANIQSFLTTLIKLKKPIVLAVTKFDICSSAWFEELSTILKKSSEFKRIPLIETSAHKNVNIEQAFLTLVKLIEKPRLLKVNYMRYSEAIRLQQSECESALAAFNKLLSHAPPEFLENWDCFMKRYSQQGDVVTFTNLVGTEVAQREFERFLQCRESLSRQHILNNIVSTLAIFLPSLDHVRDKSPQEVAKYIRSQEHFSLYFRDSSTGRNSADSHNSTGLSSSRLRDTRIPFELLTDTGSEGLASSPLQLYLNKLVMAEKCLLEKARLEAILYFHSLGCLSRGVQKSSENDVGAVLPGQPLSDLKFILDIANPTVLTDENIATVYKHFQSGLRVRAREDFLDLMLERTDLFVQSVTTYLHRLSCFPIGDNNRFSCRRSLYEQPHRKFCSCDLLDVCDSCAAASVTPIGGIFAAHNSPSGTHNHPYLFAVPPRGVKEAQLTWIDNHLSDDWRYQAMAYLPSERQTLLASNFNVLLPCFPINPPNTCVPRWSVADCKSVPEHFVTSSGQEFRHPLSFVSEPRSVLSWNQPTCYSSVHDCSLRHCPSLPLGSCMDELFRRLAYTSLPISPHCLDPSLSTTIHSPHYSLRPAEVGSPNNILPNLPPQDLSAVWNSSQLFIAVACVCTDYTAAEAVIHLLSCAGFSMTSFLSSQQYMATSVPSDSVSDCFSHSVESSVRPLTLSASWPLPVGRLPPGNSNSQRVVAGRDENRDCGVHIGRVNVTLMSLHKLISNILSSSLERDRPFESGDASDWCMDRHVYHGYIFMLGTQDDAMFKGFSANFPEMSEYKGKSIEVKPKDDSVHSVSLPPTVSSKPDEGDDSMLTPRPLSDSLFFANDVHDEASCNSHEREGFMHHPHSSLCSCCTLFKVDNQSHNMLTDCACAMCCCCPQSVVGSVPKQTQHSRQHQQFVEGTLSGSNSAEPTSHSSAYRPRAWNARFAAVRSVLDTVLKDNPYLLLLADQREHPASVNGNLATNIVSSIYPASARLCGTRLTKYPFGNNVTQSDLHCCSETNSDGKVITDSSLRFDSTSTDSLTTVHILDHLVNFFNRCWDTMGSSTNAGDMKPSHLTPPTLPFSSVASIPASDVPVSSSTVTFTPLIASLASSVQIQNTTASSVRAFSSNSSLFLTASATGRRAMQRTNRALKKLSVGTRRTNPCTTSNSTSHRPQTTAFKRVNSSKRKPNSCIGEPHSHISLSSQTLTVNSTPVPVLVSTTNAGSIRPSTIASMPSSTIGHKNTRLRSEWPTFHSSLSMLFPSRVEQPPHTSAVIPDFAKRGDDSSTMGRFRNNPFRKTIPPTSADQNRAVCHRFPSPSFIRSSGSVPNCAALVSRSQLPRCRTTDRTVSSHTLVPAQAFHSSCQSNASVHVDTSATCNALTSFSLLTSDIPGTALDASSITRLRPTSEYVAVGNFMPANSTYECSSILRGMSNSTTPLRSTDKQLLPDQQDETNAELSHDTSATTQFTLDSVDAERRSVDEMESLYEELDLAPSHSFSALDNDSHPKSTVEPLINFSTDQNIYCDPIDCLGPASLECHRCSTTNFAPGVVYSSPLDSRPHSKHHFSHSPSNHSAPGVVTFQRERQRSFSTPEDSQTTVESNIGSGSSLRTCTGHPTSVFTTSEHYHVNPQPLGYRASLKPTIISSGSSSSGVATTPICYSPFVSHSPPLNRCHDTCISSGVSVNYPSSCLSINEANLTEHVLSTDTALPIFQICSPLPRPISRTHHHHLWHHSDCPHYRFHGINLDFYPTACTSSVTPVSSQNTSFLSHPTTEHGLSTGPLKP